MAEVAPEQLPLQRMYHWEKVRPDEIYLTQPMGVGALRNYTWRQAIGEVRRMAAYLQSLGYPKGSNIGILSKNCAHWILSDLAIWMAGYVSVPLYPTLAADSVRQVLEHSECKALFVGKLDAWDKMKAGVPQGVHCISYPLSPPNDFPTWETIVAKTKPLQDSPTRPAGDLATIIYTSGTTGMPKGVMHSFGTFAKGMQILSARFGNESGDRVLSYLPLSHIAERLGVEVVSLGAGFRIFFAESLETFAADLQRARPTVFFSVPRLWVKFQQGVFAKVPRKKLDLLFRIPLLNRLIKKKILKGLGLDACRFTAGGAAPMPPDLLNWYRELGLEIIEVFGMTENLAISHSNQRGNTKPGTVGFPYTGVECRLSEVGEVLVKSPGNTMGYYKEPEKTRELFTEDGFVRTGDKGELDSEGRLRITGRVKEIFKTSKGKYVAPAPIENKLASHSRIEACCVMGANYSQPCALVVLSLDGLAAARVPAGRGELTQSLAAHLAAVNAALSDHEHLDFIAVVNDPWTVDNGFVTPTMKVRRSVIENAYGKFLDSWYTQKQPVLWQS